MSFLAGRLASTEGAYFLQESKHAVGRLAQKLPPPSPSSKPHPSSQHKQGDEASADVLPEVLRHSLPSSAFAPPPDSSLSTSSKWLLPNSPHSASAVSPEAKNPLRAFVSLPHVTFGPKRWELPTADNSILYSTANDVRRDKHPPVNSEKLKAAAEGLSQIGKAFAIATTVVFGGATLAFMFTASKLELHNIDDIKVKGKGLLQPQVEVIRDQLAPLRIWAEDKSRKWNLEAAESKERPVIVKELTRRLGSRTEN